MGLFRVCYLTFPCSFKLEENVISIDDHTPTIREIVPEKYTAIRFPRRLQELHQSVVRGQRGDEESAWSRADSG